ncbi:MAG: cupin domain-containing protein [Deltaproteobacteria bacterium]|nr:cupin domain-containing protein [Deltaproteobacteria bacterium]
MGKYTPQPEEAKLVNKVWGCEQIVINRDFCFKIMYVLPHARSSIHKHAKKDELFYVLKGPILFEVGKNIRRRREIVAHEGTIIHVPPNTWHRFTNFGSGVTQFLEASTHDDPNDSRRATKSTRNF